MNQYIEKIQKKIQGINSKINRLDGEKASLELEIAQVYFKDMTMEDLEKLWNKSNDMKRYEILEKSPYYKSHLDKLDSYGGLRSGELEEDILRCAFGDSEWMDFETCRSLFDEFLKESD